MIANAYGTGLKPEQIIGKPFFDEAHKEVGKVIGYEEKDGKCIIEIWDKETIERLNFQEKITISGLVSV